MWKDVTISYRRSDKRFWDDFILRTEGADSFLTEFAQFGGDRQFLEHLWLTWRSDRNSYDEIPGRPPKIDAAWEEIKRRSGALLTSLQKLKDNGLLSDCPPRRRAQLGNMTAILRDIPHFVTPDPKRGRGTPATNFWRIYWCSALLPYFSFLGHEDGIWNWMASWLALVEPDRKIASATTMRRWWRNDVLKPYTRRYREGKSRKNDQTPTFDLPPFHTAFFYRDWAIHHHKPIDRQKFDRIVRRRLPFPNWLGWAK